jgi:hypothetical protein
VKYNTIYILKNKEFRIINQKKYKLKNTSIREMNIMEYHSRDKVFIRLLNALLFVVLAVVTVRFSFFYGAKSLINYLDLNFYMAPYKVTYIFHAISFIAMMIFVILQLSSSSYGIKKKVTENYSYLTPASFLCMIIHIYFLNIRNFKISAVFAFILLLLTSAIYIKAQAMKRFMYNDEINMYVCPFSIFVSWSLSLLFITVNIMLTDNLTINSNAFVIIATIELMMILSLSILVLFMYKDKIFVLVQAVYLICLAVNTQINGYFMPVGYLCFLSIVVLGVFWFRIFNKNRGGK